MNPITEAYTWTSPGSGGVANNLFIRVTRKARVQNRPHGQPGPFVKLAVEYKADLSKPENRIPKPANDNKLRRSSRRRA